jgi:hypothetical protein
MLAAVHGVSCIVAVIPMNDENKRDTERVPVPAPLHGEVKVFQPMTILDVSTGGAQIETPFALQLDSLHDFRISLGERSVVVKYGRRVRRALGPRAIRHRALRRRAEGGPPGARHSRWAGC